MKKGYCKYCYKTTNWIAGEFWKCEECDANLEKMQKLQKPNKTKKIEGGN